MALEGYCSSHCPCRAWSLSVSGNVMQCNAALGCLTTVRCRGDNHRGGVQLSVIWGGYEIFFGAGIGSKCDKFCFVSCHHSSCVSMLWVGQCNSDVTSNGEAHGCYQQGDNWCGRYMILFFFALQCMQHVHGMPDEMCIVFYWLRCWSFSRHHIQYISLIWILQSGDESAPTLLVDPLLCQTGRCHCHCPHISIAGSHMWAYGCKFSRMLCGRQWVPSH